LYKCSTLEGAKNVQLFSTSLKARWVPI